MTGRSALAAGAAIVSLGGLLSAAGCAARVTGSERLEVEAPRWVLSPRAVEIRVTTHGGISNRDVLLTLIVNLNAVGSFPTERGVASIPLAAEWLRGGENQIFVKTGSERVGLEIFVVPRALLAGLAALATAAAVLTVLLVIRRRRRRPGAP